MDHLFLHHLTLVLWQRLQEGLCIGTTQTCQLSPSQAFELNVNEY